MADFLQMTGAQKRFNATSKNLRVALVSRQGCEVAELHRLGISSLTREDTNY